MNKQKQDSESYSQSPEQRIYDSSFVVPKSTLNLRACITCCLIKSKEEWQVTSRCENCGKFLKSEMMQKTTKHFTEIMSILNPGQSFILKRLRMRKRRTLRPGVYAIS